MKRIIVMCCLMLVSFTNAQKSNLILQSRGEVEAVPDIAGVSIQIESTNKELKIVKEEVVKASEELNKILGNYKIDKKDIQTTNINYNKRYEWINNKNVFTGYTAYISTNVTVRNIAVLNTLYPELLNFNKISVHGISYDVSNVNSYENEAYVKALKNCNTLAEMLLKESGFKTKKISKISLRQLENRPHYEPEYKMMAVRSADAVAESQPAISVNPGLMKIAKEIFVEYELE